MITSHANKSVKEVIQLVQKAKARKERGLFVVEGVKMFLEAPAERIEQVYISESFAKQMYSACQEKLDMLPLSYEVTTDEIFRKMSDTKTPQGILCVLKQQRSTIAPASAATYMASPALFIPSKTWQIFQGIALAQKFPSMKFYFVE